MEKLYFVIMPFGGGDEYEGGRRESDFIFNKIIKPAVDHATVDFNKQFGDGENIEPSLRVVRELENVSSGDITESIIRHISEAHVSIVDLTGRNPNVFFELGVRFSLHRNGTILLVQDIKEVPFNVRNFRIVEYDPRFDGIDKAVTELKNSIFKTLEVLADPNQSTTDSLVFQAIDDLTISISRIPETERVSWEEYWNQVVRVEQSLNELLASGVYEPDILLGISNGGLFLADTILRLVYGNKVPTLCLWALRRQENYFDNPVNNALITEELINELTKNKEAKDKIRILVMDDIVGTQRTFNQLVSYLKQRLNKLFQRIDLKFIFLFSPRLETSENLSVYLLSSDPAIIAKYEQMNLEGVTRKRDLPYRKSIHYGDITKIESNIEN
jgi:hypoxanthine phosphoribosyltransferase